MQPDTLSLYQEILRLRQENESLKRQQIDDVTALQSEIENSLFTPPEGRFSSSESAFDSMSASSHPSESSPEELNAPSEANKGAPNDSSTLSVFPESATIKPNAPWFTPDGVPVIVAAPFRNYFIPEKHLIK